MMSSVPDLDFVQSFQHLGDEILPLQVQINLVQHAFSDRDFASVSTLFDDAMHAGCTGALLVASLVGMARGEATSSPLLGV